ncbi:MAG: transglycosylase SLT domain-containing protein [Sulfuricaulis sp.]|uniref:transglycosylase SLT domain-containing protein n=1 Tax=Sulfuricaulis sp. TaxID=2003553 RepID=UPI0025E646E6|nr:transglycosylase SLT domain-containing protein [Sulfuricaulis sp.]MCR4346482.1 transglycosylase SLT domain-containing protein [Sulfuricaulis sp.]
MDCKRIKNQVLSVVFLLAAAGCATTSPETDQTAKDSASTPAAPFVSKEDSPAPVATVKPRAENTRPVATFDDGAASANHSDIWSRIRAGFSIKPLDSPLVEREARWFANNPEYMQRMMERASLYLYYIVEEVEKRGMPMEIALLPAVESAYKANAYSRARASGLWQFMPATGRLYGLKANWWYDGRRDVQASTQAALNYLEKLYNDFDGDWHLALAAYNAGEGKVGRMIKYNERKGKSTDYQYLKLKRETQHYVPKLMAMASIVADPDKYGVKLADIPNEPYFTRVETGSQVDLGVVAKLVDLPVSDLHLINPGFTRWATHPDGPHYLLVPADKKEALLEGLSNMPEEERIQWQHHAVKRGETLSEIGRRYALDAETLRTANNLRSNLLRVGQDLLIPISARPLTVAAVRTTYRSTEAHTAKRGENIVHRVRRGDTLSSIARRYNVLVNQLIKWNFIKANDILRLGQKLKIWPNGSPTAAIETPVPNG